MYLGLGWTVLAIFFRWSLLIFPRDLIIWKLPGADTKPLLKSTEMSKATANFVLENPGIKDIEQQSIFKFLEFLTKSNEVVLHLTRVVSLTD